MLLKADNASLRNGRSVDLNPGGVDEFFRTSPDRASNTPGLLYNGYRFFRGGKAAGAWRWQPTLSSTEVK